MTVVSCPLCDYETEDVSDTIAAVLLSTHAISHQPGATASSATVERVKRPVISSAGISEDWNYFFSKWNDYVEATNVTGKDEVLQLLECCDEELRRDVTRMAGGSLTNKTAKEILAAIRTLAVREKSPMVARAALYAMHQECKHCHKRHHFESVCRGKSAGREDSKDNTDAVFQSLCAVTEHFSPLCSVTILDQNPGRRTIALDHHVYDQLSKMWLRRSSEPQPYVMLIVTPVGEDYADLGFPLKSRTRSSILPSMADTGCHSCLGGMRLLPRLGMTAYDLIPVSMKMHAANGKGINIIGAAILRFSGKSPYGEPRETRQITHINDNSDKLFLSREACISLGMITARFPTVGELISSSCPQLSCAVSTD